MTEKPGDVITYGWDHVWCEKFDKLGINEYIKGVFAKPKLVCSLPFVTSFQTNIHSDPLEFKHGIPDSWADLLIHDFILAKLLPQESESMQKEDVDVSRALRKQYRLYLGQGIPDPWTTYPYSDDLKPHEYDGLRTDIKKYIFEILSGKTNIEKEETCLCCEKKYLFECPDKIAPNDYNEDDSNKLNCSCQNCHGKKVDTNLCCSDNCKCIQMVQNWVSQNADLLKQCSPQKKDKKQSSSGSSESSISSCTEPECIRKYLSKEKKQPIQCLYPQTQGAITVPCENENQGNTKCAPHELKRKNFTSFINRQAKVCFCPYVHKFNLKKKELQSKSNNSNDAGISKQIPTDPAKCDNNLRKAECSKIQRKCTCISKYSGCGIYRCKFMDSNTSHEPIVPNFCLSYPQFVCPYAYANNSSSLKHRKKKHHAAKSRKTKKQSKGRESENESCTTIAEYKTSQEECVAKTKGKELKHGKNMHIKHALFKKNQNVYYCQPSTTAFEHLKYIASNKLKYKFNDKEFPLQNINSRYINHMKPLYIPYNFENFYTKKCLNPIDLNKYKHFTYNTGFKEKHSESSCEENNTEKEKKSEYLSLKQHNAGVQTTETIKDEKKEKKEIPLKIKFIRDSIESDESRTYGLIRNCEPSSNVLKKRRRAANKKRKRRLTSKRTYIINKPSRSPDLERNSSKNQNDCAVHCIEIYPSSKKTYIKLKGNDERPSENINICENSNILLPKPGISFYPKRYSDEVLKSTVSHAKENLAKKKVMKATEKIHPYYPHSKFSVFEQISHNSGTSWSSDTLKGIVNGLLDNKQKCNLEKQENVHNN